MAGSDQEEQRAFRRHDRQYHRPSPFPLPVVHRQRPIYRNRDLHVVIADAIGVFRIVVLH